MGDVRQHDQTVRIKLFREQRGGQILVDHRLDAVQTVLVGNDGDASAAGADDDAAGVEQSLDR